MNKSNHNNHSDYSELYLFGKVIDRPQRKVPKDNPTTWTITYLGQNNWDSKFYVDNYAPTFYCDLSREISFQVFIKVYNRKKQRTILHT